VDFLDRDRAVVHNATYTTCQRDDSASWMPDWVLRAQSIRLDNVEEVGTAEGACWSSRACRCCPSRTSAFRCRTSASPGCCRPRWAWTAAMARIHPALLLEHCAQPRRHAARRLMAKRGIEPGGRVPLPGANYQGQVDARLMPTDSCATACAGVFGAAPGADQHPHGRCGPEPEPQPGERRQLLARLRARRAAAAPAPAAQRRDGCPGGRQHVGPGAHPQVADPAGCGSPIVPPYDLMPQLLWRYTPQSGAGPGCQHGGRHHRASRRTVRCLTGSPRPAQLCAWRRSAAPFWRRGASSPQAAAARHAIPVRQRRWPTARSASRALPTFSLDSGLVFERDARLLWPRLHADAGAARVLHLHALPRPEPAAAVRHRAPTTSTLPPSTPRTPMSAMTASGRQQPAHPGRDHAPAGPRHRRRGLARLGIAQRLRFPTRT
jgi:LPS-assembly protein